MKRASHFAIASILTALSACGKPLGTYQVREVRLVPGEAFEKIEPYVDADPQMLRIEFTSKSDLYERSDGGGEGLYVFASFCPYDESKTISVTEPYYNDRSRYGPRHILERKVLPNGRVFERVDVEERRPMKDATGKFVYTTYLRIRGGAREEFVPYDFRRQVRDVCLRINHPGYFITPSRSHVFTVPKQIIQRAVELR